MTFTIKVSIYERALFYFPMKLNSYLNAGSFKWEAKDSPSRQELSNFHDLSDLGMPLNAMQELQREMIQRRYAEGRAELQEFLKKHIN